MGSIGSSPATLADLRDAVLDHVYQNNEGYSRQELANQERITEIIHDATSNLIGSGLPWETFMEVLSDAGTTVEQLARNNSGLRVQDAIIDEVDTIVTYEVIDSFDQSQFATPEDDVSFHEQVLGSTRQAVRRRNAGIIVVNKRSKRSVPISVHATLEAGRLEDYGSELDELASKLIQEAYELGKLYNISWNSQQPLMHRGKVGMSGTAYEPDLTNYTRAVRDAYNSQNYASVDVEIAVG